MEREWGKERLHFLYEEEGEEEEEEEEMKDRGRELYVSGGDGE